MATREALHAVAEHVLAAALHRATGRIGLRVTPGGFGTPPFPVGGTERQVRVEGTEIVVVDDGAERRAPLGSVGQAAACAGIEPGGPASVYPLATPLDPDADLGLDHAAADVVHRWFHLTGAALDRLREDHPAGEATIAQLWPEHFDLALVMDEVNYGGSPGDDDHATPYAYVGPWNLDGLAGKDAEFWNEPFGASRPHDALQTVDDLVSFFRTGRTLAARR